MRRFVAALGAFKQRWNGWVEGLDCTCIMNTARPITDRQKQDIQAILDGVSTAHRKPKRQEAQA